MNDAGSVGGAKSWGDGQISIYDLFHTQARAEPERLAAVWGNEALTYSQLDEAVEGLAARLLGLDLGPAACMALYIPRSVDLLVACLAVWKIGAAYVPLDLAAPPARLQSALLQSRPAAILFSSTHRSAPGLETTVPFIDLAKLASQTTPTGAPGRANTPSVAYILFTSGSTGTPKGVVVDHRALTGFLCAMRDVLSLSASDRVAATSSLTFDIAAVELFLPLIVGACVHLLPEGVARDAMRLRSLIEASDVTVVQGTPSMWRILLEAGWEGGVAQVISGGEVLDPALARRLCEKVPIVWNGYGPTEATVYATLHKVDPIDLTETAIPIGEALPNAVVKVVDAEGAPVADDECGEILIGGAGLALGYLDRPDLDADKFRLHPTLGGRFYHTGDLARRRHDGVLTFLGRADGQIKFRGVRIEPGDIEQRLLSMHGVSQAAVALSRDDRGPDQIVAFMVPMPSLTVPTDVQLRSHLAQWLPEHMIPTAYIWLDRLPTTASGKIDRGALPTIDLMGEYVAPFEPTSLPEAVALAWGKALGRASLGLEENFFAAGGDSLAALNATFLAASLIGADLNVALLLEHPTPAAYAAELEKFTTAPSRQLIDVTF